VRFFNLSILENAMPFVAAPNIVQVEVRALLDGQHIENRFTIDMLAAVTPGDVVAAVDLVSTWVHDTYFPLLPNDVGLVETFGKDLTTSDGAQHSLAPTTAFNGANGTPACPNEVTFCVSFRSASSGRSARGRAYVLGLTRGLVTGNIIDATLRGQLVSAFATLHDRINTAGWAWVIVSYISGGVPRAGGPVYFPITSVTSVDNIVDSMRRRKPGVGS
jgi:hypothetical protein